MIYTLQTDSLCFLSQFSNIFELGSSLGNQFPISQVQTIFLA